MVRLAVMPDFSSQDMHTQAEALLDRRDVAGARRLYARICELTPQDADAWLMLGLIDAQAGDISTALSALRTAISHDPRLADAHFNLAALLMHADELDTAAESCEKALQIEPDYKQAWLLLGTIHGRKSEFQRAAACARRALSLDPASIDAAVNLGLALRGGGQHREAFQVYTQAVQRHPASSVLWTALGGACLTLGNRDNALQALQRAVELEPGNREALQTLAGIYLERGQAEKAAAACRALLADKPDHAAALSLLGTVNQLLGNLQEAVNCLDKAVTLQPGNAEYRYKLACACQARGELNTALAHFRRVLELEPSSATAVGGLVRVHDQKGESEEVSKLLADLMDAADRNPLVLPTLASIAPGYGIEDVSLKKLLRALDRRDIPNAVRGRLHWAAGRLYEHLGDADAAFEHHSAAKPLSGGHHDSRAHSDFIDRIIALFSREYLETAPRSGQTTGLPVFIVGMPRSGTSLVEQILASHTQVFGAGELDTLGRIAHTLPARTGSRLRFPECCRALTPGALDSAALEYLGLLRGLSAEALRITDKMPQNFLHLALVQLLFPGARIIHVRRNPLDTCLSCYFQEFSHAHGYARNLADLGLYYQDYARLMEHWRIALRVPMLQLQYEDLVAEPEPVMRRLVEFCGLPWDRRCTEFYKSGRQVATLSASQVRQPLNDRAIGKWRLYASHLEPLRRTLAGLAADWDTDR